MDTRTRLWKLIFPLLTGLACLALGACGQTKKDDNAELVRTELLSSNPLPSREFSPSAQKRQLPKFNIYSDSGRCIIKCQDGSLQQIIKCNGIWLLLADQAQRLQAREQFAHLLSHAPCRIQIVCVTQPYTRYDFEEFRQAKSKQTGEYLRWLQEYELIWLEQVVAQRGVQKRDFYMVLTSEPGDKHKPSQEKQLAERTLQIYDELKKLGTGPSFLSQDETRQLMSSILAFLPSKQPSDNKTHATGSELTAVTEEKDWLSVNKRFCQTLYLKNLPAESWLGILVGKMACQTPNILALHCEPQTPERQNQPLSAGDVPCQLGLYMSFFGSSQAEITKSIRSMQAFDLKNQGLDWATTPGYQWDALCSCLPLDEDRLHAGFLAKSSNVAATLFPMFRTDCGAQHGAAVALGVTGEPVYLEPFSSSADGHPILLVGDSDHERNYAVGLLTCRFLARGYRCLVLSDAPSVRRLAKTFGKPECNYSSDTEKGVTLAPTNMKPLTLVGLSTSASLPAQTLTSLLKDAAKELAQREPCIIVLHLPSRTLKQIPKDIADGILKLTQRGAAVVVASDPNIWLDERFVETFRNSRTKILLPHREAPLASSTMDNCKLSSPLRYALESISKNANSREDIEVVYLTDENAGQVHLLLSPLEQSLCSLSDTEFDELLAAQRAKEPHLNETDVCRMVTYNFKGLNFNKK